jgi:hypothetical protein
MWQEERKILITDKRKRIFIRDKQKWLVQKSNSHWTIVCVAIVIEIIETNSRGRFYKNTK